MTTSGSYDFSVTALEIITAAAENLGLISSGGTLSSAYRATMLQRLNFIAKQWSGNADMEQGLKFHTRQRLTLFLAKGQQTYSISPSGDNCTAQYGRTTISATEAAGQTVLSITSNTDTTTYPGTTVTMTNSDKVGIQLDDGTIQWTTISGTPSTTMTVGAALTGQASAGNYVWWYTNKAQRFPLLEYAVLRNSSYQDTSLEIFREVSEYEQLPDKGADGDPISLLCEPLRTSTRITLDMQPTDVTKVINMTVQYPAEDYDDAAGADDIAFPQEWFAALEWELTLRCCAIFERKWTPVMQQNYQQATAIARQLNPAECTAYFMPGER